MPEQKKQQQRLRGCAQACRWTARVQAARSTVQSASQARSSRTHVAWRAPRRIGDRVPHSPWTPPRIPLCFSPRPGRSNQIQADRIRVSHLHRGLLSPSFSTKYAQSWGFNRSDSIKNQGNWEVVFRDCKFAIADRSINPDKKRRRENKSALFPSTRRRSFF